MTDSPFRTPDYGDRLHRLEAAVANLEKTVGKLNKTPARPRRSLMEWIEEHVPVLLIVVLAAVVATAIFFGVRSDEHLARETRAAAERLCKGLNAAYVRHGQSVVCSRDGKLLVAREKDDGTLEVR